MLSSILPSAKAITRGPRLGFCLDFACVRMGASLECQVLSTFPGFPVECQMAAGAPWWNSCPNPVQGLAECTELLWGALSSVPKALGAPGWAQCPHSCVSITHRAQKEFPFPGGSPHHFHRASGMTDMEGRWSLVRSERRKGRCHPVSSVQAQAVDPWEEDPTDSIRKSLAPRTFPYSSENPPC